MKERQAAPGRGVVDAPAHPHQQQHNQQQHKRKKKKSQQQPVTSDGGTPHVSHRHPATPPSAAVSHGHLGASGSRGSAGYNGHQYNHSHDLSVSQLSSCHEYRHDQSNSQLSACHEYRHDQSNSQLSACHEYRHDQSNSQLSACHEYHHDQSNSQLSSCPEYRHDQSMNQLPSCHGCCEEMPACHATTDGRGSYPGGRVIAPTPSVPLVGGGRAGVGSRHGGFEGGHRPDNGVMYDGRLVGPAAVVVDAGSRGGRMMMAEGASFSSPSRSEQQLKRASWSAFPPNYDAATGFPTPHLPQNQHFSRTDFLATDAASRQRNLQNIYKSQSIENLDMNKSMSTENLKKSKKKSGFGSIRFTPAFLRGSANSIKELFSGIGSNSGSKSQSKFSVDSLEGLPGNDQSIHNIHNDTQNLSGSRRHSIGNYHHLNSSNTGSVAVNPTQHHGVNHWDQHSVGQRQSYTQGCGSGSSARDFNMQSVVSHTGMDIGSSRDCEPVPLEGPCQLCGMDVSLHSTLGCRRLRGSNMSVGARRWVNDAASGGGGSCRNSGVFTVMEEDEGDSTLDRSRELLQNASRDAGAGRAGGSAASTPSVKILHAHLKQDSSRPYDQRYPMNHGDSFSSVTSSVGAPRHPMQQSQSIPYSLAAAQQHNSHSSSVPQSDIMMSSSFDSRSGMKLVSRELILSRQSSVPYGSVVTEVAPHSGYSASSLQPSIRDRSNSVAVGRRDYPPRIEEFGRPERSFRELETSLEYANRCFRDNSNGSNDEACCDDVNKCGAGGKAGTGGKENVVPNNRRGTTKSNSFKHNFRFMNGKSFFPKLDGGKKKSGKSSKGKSSSKKGVKGVSKSNSASPKTKASTSLSAPGVVDDTDSDSSSDGRSLASFVNDIKRRSLRVTAATDFIRAPTKGPKFLRSSLRSSSKSASCSVKSNSSSAATQSLNQSSQSVVSNAASSTKLDTSFSYLAFNKRRLNKLTSSSRSTQSAPPCPPSPQKNANASTWTCECCDQMCVECSGGVPEETICQLPGCCPPTHGGQPSGDHLQSDKGQLPEERTELPLEADTDLEATIPSSRMARLAPGYDRSLKKYKKNKRFKKVRKVHNGEKNNTDEHDGDTSLTTDQSCSSIQLPTEECSQHQPSNSSSSRLGDIRSSEISDSLNVNEDRSLNDSVFIEEESPVVLRHKPRPQGSGSAQGPRAYHSGAYGNTHPPFTNIHQAQSGFHLPPRALSYGQVPYFQVPALGAVNGSNKAQASASSHRDADVPSSSEGCRLKPPTSLRVGLPTVPPSPSPSMATYASPSLFRELAAAGNKVCLSPDYASPLDKKAPMQFPSKADPDLESPMYTCPIVFELDDADEPQTSDAVQRPVASGSYQKPQSDQRAKKPNGGNVFFGSPHRSSLVGSTQSLSVCSRTSSVDRRGAGGRPRDGDLSKRHSVVSSEANAFQEPCDPELREPFSLNHRSVSCQSVNRSSSSSCQSLAMSAARAPSSSSSSVASCHSRNTRLSSDASSLARLNNEQKKARAAKMKSTLIETFNGRRGDETTMVEASPTSEPFYENFGNFTINRLFFQSQFEEYKIDMSETSLGSRTDLENCDAQCTLEKESHEANSAKKEGLDRTLYGFFPVPDKNNFPGRNRITSEDVSDDSFHFTDVEADQNDISIERASINTNSYKSKTESRPDSSLAFEALFPRLKTEQLKEGSANSGSLGSNSKNSLNRSAASREDVASCDRRQLPSLKSSGLSFEAELEAQLEASLPAGGNRRSAELSDDQALDSSGAQVRQSSSAGLQSSSRPHTPSFDTTHNFSTPPPLPPPLPRRVLDSVQSYASSIPYHGQLVPTSCCAQAPPCCSFSAPPTPCGPPPPSSCTPSTFPLAYTNNQSYMNVPRSTDSNRSTQSSASCHSTKSQPAHGSHSRATDSSTGSWGPSSHRGHSNPMFAVPSEEASRHSHSSGSKSGRNGHQHPGNFAGSMTSFLEPLGSSTLKPPSSECSSDGTISRFIRGVDQASLDSINGPHRHSRSSFNPAESNPNVSVGSHASLAACKSLEGVGNSVDRQHPVTPVNMNRSQSSMLSPSVSVTGLSALFNSNLSLHSLTAQTPPQHSSQSSLHYNPSPVHLPNRTSSFLSHSSSSTTTTSLHRPSSSSDSAAAMSPCSGLSSSAFQDSPRPSSSSRDGSCCCRDCCSSPDAKSDAAPSLPCDSTLRLSTSSTTNNTPSFSVAQSTPQPGGAAVLSAQPCGAFMLGEDITNAGNIERLRHELRCLKASDCKLMVQLINLHSQIQEMSGLPYMSPPPSPPPCLRSPLRAALASAAPSSQYFRRGVPPTPTPKSGPGAASSQSLNGSSSAVAGLETAPSTPVMDDADVTANNFNTYANIETMMPSCYPGDVDRLANMEVVVDSLSSQRRSTNGISIISAELKDPRSRSSSLSVAPRSNPCPNPPRSFSDRVAPSDAFSGHRKVFRTTTTTTTTTSCGRSSSAAVAGSAPCPAPCPAHLRDEVVSALLHRQRLQRGPDGELQDGSGLVTVL